MKMYVFPGDELQAAEDLRNDKPIVRRGFDAAILRFGVVFLAWTAGAGAAALLVQFG